MVSRELVAASTRPLVLSVLKRGESYGYSIIQQVASLSGGELEWSEGMLYPVLHRLEKEKLILSRWKTGESGRKRKYYRLSSSGRKAAKHMSSLKQSTELKIREWTLELAKAETLAPDRLKELESHFVESLLSLRECGLTEDEAFVIASSRLGSVDALSDEFAKSGDAYLWANRMYWMCLGYLGIMLAMRVVGSLVSLTSLAVATAVNDPLVLSISGTAVRIIGLLLIAAGMLWQAKRRNGFRLNFTPVRFILGICLVVVVTGGLSIASRLMLAQTISLQSFGITAQHTAYVGMVSSLAIPICFGLLALRLRVLRLSDTA